VVDLDALLEPVLKDVPEAKPFAVVRIRAAAIRRRRKIRRIATAFAAVAAIGGGTVALVSTRDQRTAVVVAGPSRSKTPHVRIGPATTFKVPAMDMLAAFGSIWVSQPDQVARLDPATGRVQATISVPGTSDFRNLAAGAGSLWVDDTGTATLTRIDPVHNAVVKSVTMNASPLVIDGLAFVDGQLWIVRPEPENVSRGDVVAIDPSTYQIVQHATIPRTFTVMAGETHALWYVRGSDLLRFDTRSLAVTTVRHDAVAILAVTNGHLWLLTTRGVVQVDESTGAQIGSPINSPGTVNVTAAVSSDVIWLGAQPDSSRPGSVTPYDIATGRRLASPTPVGLPLTAMTAVENALWVDAGGLSRIPFRLIYP
jgi:hypothetical protein